MKGINPSRISKKIVYIAGGVAVVLGLVLYFIFGRDGEASGAMPPSMVTAVVVERADTPVSYEYMGQTVGSREVQVRARTGGILLERHYIEGGYVEEGDLLFTIDPEKSDANLAQTVGELARQRATLENAKRDRDRLVKLFKDGAVSASERDNAVTAYQSALASVQESEARMNDARISRNYSEVRAPISGMTSKETLSEGSLVITGESVLTTISQLRPMYVNFSVPGAEGLNARRMVAKGLIALPEAGLDLRLRLVDGSMYPRVGFINFEDKRVDPETGSIRMRGQFPNPDDLILPGQYVRVFVEGAVMADALLVPQSAVLFTQQGPIVYALDENNVAQARPVVLGQTIEDSYIVAEGLENGERIVSQGVIKVRPGVPVSIRAEGPPPGAQPDQPGQGEGGGQKQPEGEQ